MWFRRLNFGESSPLHTHTYPGRAGVALGRAGVCSADVGRNRYRWRCRERRGWGLLRTGACAGTGFPCLELPGCVEPVETRIAGVRCVLRAGPQQSPGCHRVWQYRQQARSLPAVVVQAVALWSPVATSAESLQVAAGSELCVRSGALLKRTLRTD